LVWQAEGQADKFASGISDFKTAEEQIFCGFFF
jgi:hypothetical protein